jgi:NhaC family Na+:H+ antiporter
MESRAARRREPSLAEAAPPVLVLIGLLAASVYLFGDGSSGGPNQIALILAAAVAMVVAGGWRRDGRELFSLAGVC